MIFGAFRGDFRMSLSNAALMKDTDGVLEKQGANTRHPDMIRFENNEQVAETEPIMQSYLKEAMGHAEAGVKALKRATRG